MRSAAPLARPRRPAGAWVPTGRSLRSSAWRRRFRLRIRADVVLVLLMVAASLLGTAWAATSPGSPRVGIMLGVLAFAGACPALLLFGWTTLRTRALARLAGGSRTNDGARRIEEHGRLFAGWFSAHQLAWLTVGLTLATPLLLPRGASSDLSLATIGGLLTVAACALVGALSAARPLLSEQAAALAVCWLSPIPHAVRPVLPRAEALLLLPTRLAQVRAWDAGQPQPLLRKIVQVREAARLGRAGFVLDIRPARDVNWRTEVSQRAAVYGVIWLFGALVALLALRAGLIAPLVPALTSITGAAPLAATPTPASQATPTPGADGGSDAPQQGAGPGQGASQGSGSGAGGSAADGQGEGSGSGQGGGQSQGNGDGQGQGQGAGDGTGQGDRSGQGQGPGAVQGQGQGAGQGQATGQQGQGSGQGQGAGQDSGPQQGQPGGDGQNQQGDGAGQSGDGQQSGQGQSPGEQGQAQQAPGQGAGQQQQDPGQAGGGQQQGQGNGGGQQGDQQPGDSAQQGTNPGSGNTGSGAGAGPGSSRNGDPNTPPTPPQMGAPTPVQIPSAKSTDDIVSIDLPAMGPGQQAEGTPQPLPGTPLPAQSGQAGPQGPNASGTATQGSRSAGQPLPSWIQSLLDGASAP